MRSLATNSDNDIYFGADGNLAIIYDLPAVVQACEHASKVLLGELPYAQLRGIKFFDVGFTSSPDLGLYSSQLISILKTVPHVEEITSLTFKRTGTTLQYEATIVTEFGSEVISGSV
ncbi:baseplate wedge protein [Yersinia phage vB_YenM_P744]